jgi:NADH:ubiquinone oxidoreductase subunit 2 (subunit N)
MVLSITIFGLLLSIRKWNNNLKIKKINEVIYLLKSNYLLAIIFCLTLFSIAGIPPLIGFYSKFYIFMAGIHSGFYLIVIIAAVISVISAMYYIKLIKLMFFKQFSYITFLNKIPYSNSVIISSTFLLNFLFLFLPSLLIMFLHNILLNLFI